MKTMPWLLLAVAVVVSVILWYRKPEVKVVRTIHSIVNPSATRTITQLADRLNRSNARYDSAHQVIKKLQVALSRIDLKTASPATLDSIRTVLVPPGPKTDTTYCIDLSEARELYEIKAKEPIKDALIKQHQATADSLHADLLAVQVGIDSLQRLNEAKDSAAQALFQYNQEMEDKLDRPFSVGPHLGWDIRNQPTVGISVQYSLFRFRLWKKRK